MIEGLLYDWENERTLQRQNLDIGFYQKLLAHHPCASGRVLELGCGTGRITLPLARAGHRITGVDRSTDRLSVLRSKEGAGAIDIVQADMCDYSAPGQFGFILVPYSSFLMLDAPSARVTCLARIAENLRPDGVAVVDLSPNFLAHRETEEALVLDGDCTALDAHVRYFEAVRQDYVRQITHFSKRYTLRPLDLAAPRCAPGELRLEERWHTLKVDEMRWLVAQAGLRIAEIFGTYGMEPLFDGEAWRPGSYKNIYVFVRGES